MLPTFNDATKVEPPKEKPIIFVGRIIQEVGGFTAVVPLCGCYIWLKDKSGYEGWHHDQQDEFGTRLTVANYEGDRVICDYWSEVPGEELPIAVVSKEPLKFCDCGEQIDGEGRSCFTCEQLEINRRHRLHHRRGEYAREANA